MKHSDTKITDGRKGFIWLTFPKMTVHPSVENKVRNPEAIIPSLLAKNLICGQYIPAFNSQKQDFMDAKTAEIWGRRHRRPIYSMCTVGGYFS